MKLLLVEDNPADARLIREMLLELPERPQLEHFKRLDAALERLRQERFDLVLLDLGLPDAQGIDTLKLALAGQNPPPIVVLTGLDDLAVAIETVRTGAQDYLVKGRFDRELLSRTIAYAIERKSAEQRIHHLAAIVDSCDEAIIGMNLSGIILSWNRGAERIYGYSAQEMIGQPASRLLLPEQVDKFPSRLSRLSRGEVMELYETVRRRKDGRPVQVVVRMSSVKDSSGGIVGVSTIALDITQQRQTEQALRNLNRDLRVVCACNEALVRATGEEELLTQSCRIISELGEYPIIWIGLHEGGAPGTLALRAHAGADEDFWEAVRQLCASGAGEAGLGRQALAERHPVVCADMDARPETCRRTAAAQYGYKSMMALPLFCYGKSLGVVTLYASKEDSFDARELTLLEELAADIAFGLTALRTKAEHDLALQNLQLAHERLRKLVDANIVGVVIASPSGRIIEANDYYLRITGFTRAEFQAGQLDWRAITPPEWLPADEQAIAELRRDGTCAPYEKEYLRRDGTRVPVYFADGLLPGAEELIIAFVLDLTERKRIEIDLRQVVERLARSNAELRRFNQVAVDRELRMVQLKQQVNELSQELGRPRPFSELAKEGESSEANATAAPQHDDSL